MSPFQRLLDQLPEVDRGQLIRLSALMGLFFLVICAIGILRPIKNALALSGLGDTLFYQVYVISAGVVLFVPLYNWVGDRVRWRRLIVGTGLAFAAVLLVFRATYSPGSTAFGLLFYGWYDLLAAVMVTQFFMAAQLYFDARTAKKFYPFVIAGGSLGATLGGLITGLAADAVGVPNLILLAAVLIGVFALLVPLVTEPEQTVETEGLSLKEEDDEASPLGDLKQVFGDSQVRLITASVLLTVLVKQLVDYQFNTISEQVYVTPEAISEFQGWFNAGTQWLPLVVLAGLRPLLSRWGLAVALFLFPVFMLGANVGLALTWSLAAAVVGKGGDTAIRYAAERTTREILYVPVPEDLKMRAKGYIDVAVEKGVGKVLSAVLIGGLLAVMDYRHVGWVGAGLATVGVLTAVAIRKEYVRSLARSFRSRLVQLEGLFPSLHDTDTLDVVEETLREGDPGEIAFVLDLLVGGERDRIRPLFGAVEDLLVHPEPEIRRRALEVLARLPAVCDENVLRPLLTDDSAPVRRAAVRAWALAAESVGGPERRPVSELLATGDTTIRRAVFEAAARDELPGDGAAPVDAGYLAERWDAAARGDRRARLDVARAAAAADDPSAMEGYLEELIADPDREVAAAAVRSAGQLRLRSLYPALVEALGSAATRGAATDALAAQGTDVVELLGRRLTDETGTIEVRRNIPRILARVPCQASADVLLRSYASPETDQLLDYRTLKALNKLRARDRSFRFDRAVVRSVQDREVEAARRYAGAEAALAARGGEEGPATALLRQALREAWQQRREAAFRCLGLLEPPEEVHRCYLALVRGERRSRASALEWLESTLGRERYQQLGPVLPEGAHPRGAGGEPPPLAEVLRALGRDKDRWLTRCALWAAAELGVADLRALTEGTSGDVRDRDLRRLADRLEERNLRAGGAAPGPERD